MLGAEILGERGGHDPAAKVRRRLEVGLARFARRRRNELVQLHSGPCKKHIKYASVDII